jgi:hypothetical protein
VDMDALTELSFTTLRSTEGGGHGESFTEEQVGPGGCGAGVEHGGKTGGGSGKRGRGAGRAPVG